jgi:predicted MarR family transcription regulator
MAAKKTSTAKSRPQNAQRSPRLSAVKSTWHLAQTPNEQVLSHLEIGMERLIHAYYRWKTNCLATLGDFGLTGDDITILNIIRMGDEPKKLTEVARILNRADTSNMQYATRKLIKAGLIEKRNEASRKDTTYQATQRGIEVTDSYAAVRRELVTTRLGDAIDDPERLAELRATFDELIQLYEQGTMRASTISAGFAEVGE